MTPDVTALILAGGQARRMGGRNKALLEVGGETLLERLRRELAPRVTRVLVSVAQPVTWTELPQLCDPVPGAGPLGAIAAGLAAAPQWLLVVAVDMPFLAGPVLDLLLGDLDTAAPDAVAFRVAGLPEPLVALWHVRARSVVERRVASRQLKVAAALLDPELQVRWIDEAEVRRVDLELRSFVNLNDTDDLATL